MLGLLSLAVSAYVVGFSGALVPGPLTAMTVAESARRGFRAGPLLTLGHAVAEVAIVVALAVGLNRFFQQPLVSGLIAFCGGLVLLWMFRRHRVWTLTSRLLTLLIAVACFAGEVALLRWWRTFWSV